MFRVKQQRLLVIFIYIIGGFHLAKVKRRLIVEAEPVPKETSRSENDPVTARSTGITKQLFQRYLMLISKSF